MKLDIILGTLFLASVIVRTQQEEIRAWNNRLYPTNSVYEVPPAVQSLNKNNADQRSTSHGVSKETDDVVDDDDDDDEEDPGGGEEQYDEDYKVEDVIDESREREAKKETHYETKEESSSVEYDYDYDYYDNETDSQAPESSHVPDYALSNETSIDVENITDKIHETSTKATEEDILIGEAVVSVVTTKSVVNGTFSVPTPLPSTTEQMLAPPTSSANASSVATEASDVLQSTEDSRIVASVQTSRSISGARFLPFNLNTDEQSTDREALQDSNNKTAPLESTESIIDKLDRVQSELSSGFLTGGFRTAGNALQLDVLGEQRPTPTRKTFTTTGKTPVISKFMPRKLTDRKPSIVASTEVPAAKSSESSEVMSDEAVHEKPKSLFKIPWPGSPRARASTTESSRSTTKKSRNEAQDISAFLPPGYRLKQEDKTTEKSLLSEILAKSNVNIAALLPAGYKAKEEITTERPKILANLFATSKVDISAFLPPDFNKRKVSDEMITERPSTTTTTTTPSTPIQKSLQELFSKSSVDISALLPPGFQGPKNNNEGTTVGSALKPVELTTKAPGGIKLVFPSRPGGRKAVPKTTTPAIKAGDSPSAVTPKIQKGWATRSTTEFTGWPSPSTTPISIEKLLEAARTATVSSVNSSVTSTTSEVPTTPRTTTTTTTIRPTTPGVCHEECEVAGTIRIIGNATWMPELLDRNTIEWQQLADNIEKEMNLVFLKSAILRKWYKNVRIDAFSQGSILVDYFVELQDLSQKINTQELKVLFHDSLRTYNAHRWNETKVKGPMRLGEFIIDPKSTDFVVIPKSNVPQGVEKDDRLIPQWAIAVIVIGVGGLLFIIVFGVSVLVNKQNAAKLKPSVTGMYGEEAAKNIIQSSHVAASHRSSQDYPKSEISTIWNDADAWREKSFESNSNKILVDGMLVDDKKYNVYDSWRSEWNGYYYQPSHTSSKFAGYESTAGFSRHPPDYDTNF